MSGLGFAVVAVLYVVVAAVLLALILSWFPDGDEGEEVGRPFDWARD